MRASSKFKYSMLGLTALVFGAIGAQAQVAGNYAGTTADGSNITFTVDTDSNTGKLEIAGFGLNANEACSGNTTLSTDWGFFMGQDITNGTASLLYPNGFYDQYLYITGSVTFTGQTASGTVASVYPALKAKLKKGQPTMPTAALFCKSLSQSFTASYIGPANANAPASSSTVIQHIVRPAP